MVERLRSDIESWDVDKADAGAKDKEYEIIELEDGSYLIRNIDNPDDYYMWTGDGSHLPIHVQIALMNQLRKAGEEVEDETAKTDPKTETDTTDDEPRYTEQEWIQRMQQGEGPTGFDFGGSAGRREASPGAPSWVQQAQTFGGPPTFFQQYGISPMMERRRAEKAGYSDTYWHQPHYYSDPTMSPHYQSGYHDRVTGHAMEPLAEDPAAKQDYIGQDTHRRIQDKLAEKRSAARESDAVNRKRREEEMGRVAKGGPPTSKSVRPR